MGLWPLTPARPVGRVRRFSAAYGKELTVAGARWRYYRLGSGPAVVWLTGGAQNDPTQNSNDKARYEKLLGRPVEVISMGQVGHIACLLAPHQYVTWLEQALAGSARRIRA